MKLRLLETQLGLRNSVTRIPFRYGRACLTRCPQAVLRVRIEAAGGVQDGYSGDCLPPSWFDKSPEKDYAQQINEMLDAIQQAERVLAEELAAEADFFPAWLAAYHRIQTHAQQIQRTPLLASFGLSMMERALLDAMARRVGVSFFQAVHENLFGIVPGEVHPRLADCDFAEWLPARPPAAVFVRHTVGLGDPLTDAEIPASEKLADGFPQSLESYIQQCGIRYLKIKVSNQHDHDIARLKAVARVIERHRGADYAVTLDGNEQYKAADQLAMLIDALRSDDELQTLWANTLLIEQPFDRHVALDEQCAGGIRELSATKPVIIDESDGELDSFSAAANLGYRGVSSKNCKGPIKSLLNAGLIWHMNDCGRRNDFVMSGEDLCNVGIVPVQADLCLIATLGLKHVERNGHHYHPGLSYLPVDQQQAALEHHPDLYAEQHGRVAPHLDDGKFEIGSLQCPGFGFDVMPDMAAMQPASEWQFASLGLSE